MEGTPAGPAAARDDPAFHVIPGQRWFNAHFDKLAAASVLVRRALALLCLAFAAVKYRAPPGAYPVLAQELDASVPLQERAMLGRGVGVLAFVFALLLWAQSLPMPGASLTGAGGSWLLGARTPHPAS